MHVICIHVYVCSDVASLAPGNEASGDVIHPSFGPVCSCLVVLFCVGEVHL